MVTNAVYFSDGYGLKKVNIAALVGESQTVVSTIISTPSIPSNDVGYIYGEEVDSNVFLTFSFLDNNLDGCYVAKNDTVFSQYSDGYDILFPKINDRGILYLINAQRNSIEVYYGAHTRFGPRLPDYEYSISSTPALFGGNIVCLNITNNSSSQMSNGTRLYVGTTLGLTRIDAFDAESPDGYCSGLDNLGIATSYSISGGGADYEILGGTVPRVSIITADEDKMIMFAATNDGSGNGGITQVLMGTNKKIIFMTKENRLLPTNDVVDIFL